MKEITSITFIIILFISGSAHAYIGPGLGLGAIGVLLGLLLSILLAVAAVFWYPIKRMLKGRKKNKESDEDGNKEKSGGSQEDGP